MFPWLCSTGLPGHLARSERLPRRYAHNHCDVFCLIKHQLADDELCQDPLLVFPGDEAVAVRNFWKNAVKHKGEKNKFGTGKGWSAQRASWRSEGVPSVQQGHKLYAQFSRRGAICKAWFPATWVFGERWHYAGIFDGCPPATAAAKAAAAQSSCPFPS